MPNTVQGCKSCAQSRGNLGANRDTGSLTQLHLFDGVINQDGCMAAMNEAAERHNREGQSQIILTVNFVIARSRVWERKRDVGSNDVDSIDMSYRLAKRRGESRYGNIVLSQRASRHARQMHQDIYI